MLTVLIVLLLVSAFVLGAWLSVYLYGQFARRARGAPSHSLATSGPETPIDGMVAPLTCERPDRTGLVLVEDNLDAFAVRALTARHAGRSLDVMYYIWKRDLTGRLLARELVNAADRGVRIRILLDDLNTYGHDRTWLTLDAHPNMAVRLFNPARSRKGAFKRGVEMLLRAFSATRRMHTKAWIADGQLALIGGRNIGDAYFDAGMSANFRDLDLLVLGKSVRHTAELFDQYWNSAGALPIRALHPRRRTIPTRLTRSLASDARSSQARPYLQRVRARKSVREMLSGDGRIFWTSHAEVIADPPEKALGATQDAWLINYVRPVISSASRNLHIMSPYFVPRRPGTDLLTGLVRRGARVRVLTNSLAATDVMAVHGAYARWREQLLAGGVELFELKPYATHKRDSLFGSSVASLHTKAFTIDDRTGFVGSMNFDPRSTSLNCEMGIQFVHPGLTREIQRVFAEQASPQKSYRLRLDKDGLGWEDLSQDTLRILRGEPAARPWRRIVACIVRILPIDAQL